MPGATGSKDRQGLREGKAMQTIRSLAELRAAMMVLRHDHGSVAFVPTMGALHEGHLTLVREARRKADHVVASIFVNPKQFGPNEDLAAYPRREAEDAVKLASEGVALLWLPDVATMYPAGYATRISVGGLDAVLCGAARPGHFDGVATVVAKLFNQVAPDIALFGEKDWQQLAIIRRMVIDLDLHVEIAGVPTVREPNGLAMSSRNAYLTPEQRGAAAALPKALSDAAEKLGNGTAAAPILDAAKASILRAGFAGIDYLDLRDGESLDALDGARGGARLFVAARIGTTRLIDNIAVG